MKEILAYLFLLFAIGLVPYTITATYKNILYKHRTSDLLKPIIIFLISLGIELLYLVYLYFTKIK